MEKIKHLLKPKQPAFLSSDTFLDNHQDEIPNQELKGALAETVYNGLNVISIGIATLYFIIAIFNIFILPQSVSLILTLAATTIGIACLLVNIAVRKAFISSNKANSVGALLAFLAASYSFTSFYLYSSSKETIGLSLIIFSIGCFILSLRWFLTVVVLILSGWLILMLVTPQNDWLYYASVIGSSSILSFLVFQTRMHALEKFEMLSLRCYSREVELGHVLEEKETSNLKLLDTLKRLKSSQEDLQILLNSINGIVWEVDIDTLEFIFISKKAEAILGYKLSEWLGEKDFREKNIYLDDEEKVKEFWRQATNVGKDQEIEYRMIAKNGNIVWLRNIMTVLKEKGQVAKISGVMFDITDHKKIELALIRSERRYRDLFEKATDIIYSHDLEGNFTSINSQAEILLGYSREEMLKMNISQVLEASILARIKERIGLRLKGENVPAHELELIAKNGNKVIFEVNSWLEWENKKPVSVYGIARDITERKRIEEALKDSERRYRELFNTAPIGIYRTTPDGKVIDANPVVVQMLGCNSLEELIERNLEIEGIDANYSRKEFKEELEIKGQIIGLESEWTTRTGEKKFIRENAKIVKSSSGEVLYYDGTIEDITDRKNTENSLRNREKQYRVLFENNPCPSWVYDTENLSFLAVNNAAIEHYGYTREEFDKLTVKDIRPIEEIARFISYVEEEKKPESNVWYWKHCKKDGTIFDVEVRSDEVIFEGKKARLVLAKDITELKQTEELLKIARDNALESAQLKAQFLANMSHEIRTPLNGIIGMAYLLMDTELTESQYEYLKAINSCGDTLITIVNNILDLSKIEAGKLELEESSFNLEVLLEEVIKIFTSKVISKGISINYQIASDVITDLVGDTNRLRQILMNLVGNAVKFTERGRVIINVKIDDIKIEEITLRFEIIDTGIGITKEVCDNLFHPFVQADSSTTREYGGTGLGLAICKQLVEIMGGKIGVSSQLKEGSTFWFTVKLAKQQFISQNEADKAFKVFLQDLRLLIISSNRLHWEMIENQAIDWKLRLEYIANGTSALQLIRQAVKQSDPYEVAIIDTKLPDLSGMDLARVIKSDPSIANLKLIMLSSALTSSLKKDVGNIDIEAYLYKPITQMQFYDCLRFVLRSSLKKKFTEYSQFEEATYTLGSDFQAKILLVEDNLVNQSVAVSILNKLGCSVDIASNGLKALGKLLIHSYDLIFMDCQMPIMDGFETTAIIRNEERNGKYAKRTPVIALTAGVMPEDRMRCLAVGMDEVVTKPFNPQQIADVLSKWLLNDFKLPRVEEEKKQFPEEIIDNNELVTLDLNMFVQLAAVSQEDTAFFSRIIKLFLKTTNESLTVLNTLAQNNDITNLKKEAHKLKSACGNVGAVKMASLCNILEKAEDIANSQKFVIELNTEYDCLKKEFKYRFGI